MHNVTVTAPEIRQRSAVGRMPPKRISMPLWLLAPMVRSYRSMLAAVQAKANQAPSEDAAQPCSPVNEATLQGGPMTIMTAQLSDSQKAFAAHFLRLAQRHPALLDVSQTSSSNAWRRRYTGGRSHRPSMLAWQPASASQSGATLSAIHDSNPEPRNTAAEVRGYQSGTQGRRQVQGFQGVLAEAQASPAFSDGLHRSFSPVRSLRPYPAALPRSETGVLTNSCIEDAASQVAAMLLQQQQQADRSGVVPLPSITPNSSPLRLLQPAPPPSSDADCAGSVAGGASIATAAAAASRSRPSSYRRLVPLRAGMDGQPDASFGALPGTFLERLHAAPKSTMPLRVVGQAATGGAPSNPAARPAHRDELLHLPPITPSQSNQRCLFAGPGQNIPTAPPLTIQTFRTCLKPAAVDSTRVSPTPTSDSDGEADSSGTISPKRPVLHAAGASCRGLPYKLQAMASSGSPPRSVRMAGGGGLPTCRPQLPLTAAAAAASVSALSSIGPGALNGPSSQFKILGVGTGATENQRLM